MRIFLLLVCATLFLPGQVKAQSDSLELFSLESYLTVVQNYHPMAVAAGLQTDRGEAALLRARGAFDPKLNAGLDQKYFDDKSYFSLLQADLKIPTPFALEFKTGYEQNQGVFLNPENNLPQGGLWYAGATLPLGQGLFFDERRAGLRQAEFFRDATEAQRRLLLNELLFEAAAVYWQWYEAYYQFVVFEEGLRLAEDRFDAVVEYAARGDRPAVDTLEASIQVQNRQLLLQQGTLDLRNAELALTNFIWGEDATADRLLGIAPPEVGDNPESTPDLIWQTGIPDSFLVNHPKLALLEAEVLQLEVEQRWKREQLKPQLDLSYQPLLEATGSDALAAFSVANYKWGFDFSFPLFLRKERGSLELTNIKIQETRLKQQDQQRRLANKANAYRNEWLLLQEQVALYRRTVRDYARLLDAERELFNNGESSLFLINSREMSYQSARLKLIELLAKQQKSAAAVAYALAQLDQF
jgi:outer membrane protein TolC